MNRFPDSERYVVTGMGLVSPIGNDVGTAWQNALDGKHGITYETNDLFDGYGSLPISVAASVKDLDLGTDPAFASHHRKDIRSDAWDSAQRFILWASASALRQAGIISDNTLRVDEASVLEPDRFGVIIGTGVGGTNGLADERVLLEAERQTYMQAVAKGDDELIKALEGATRTKPSLLLHSLPGRVAATPSMVFGAKAFWKGLLQECASGNAPIIAAIEAIKLDKADVVLAGGVEGAITPVTTALFGAAKAVSKEKNPDIACRPFDANRTGLVMGQGAGALVIESLKHARDRGADILAEVIGYAENADAKDNTTPDPANVIKCINKALAMTGRPARNVAINNHATATGLGDRAEALAVSGAFEPDQLVGITSTKGVTGHMFGGAGAFEAAMAIMSVRQGVTPPTHGLETPLDELKGYEHLLSGGSPIPADIDMALNFSFGFGGNNAVTAFALPK